ncbi:serine/threonine-protein kinase MARK2 [Diaporthe amygdali]|uniref:serine/threonine-protein kinase MARK2 n=1 Tax=Phomopsis amygdali TaxID=1214568 RepID=UPI0022FEDEB1|nr:serine/threonine-protein kinase MARK2 [Diaporthe amygdali]KAJ0122237.1 serine/threonine-protein kinase MARK2 [Diaporthe amygdali]
MSSAALQSAPHQTATSVTLNSPPLVAASSGSRHQQQQQQQFQQSTSSPARDPYYATTQNSTSSPSASKRPTRKHSGNGSGKGDAPSQSNSPMSSRAALASPIPVDPSDQYQHPSSDRRKNMPATSVPPRTSSQHTAGVPSGASTSRRSTTQGADRSASQRHAGNDANGQVSASQAYQDEAAAQSSRSRKSAHTGPDQSHKASSSSSHRDSRAASGSTSLPIRSQQTSSTTPQGPSREASEILNSMLVSQPEVDIERSRAREALAQPHPTETPDDDTASPPVVASAEPHGEETRRGGRSRHDFSKREKHTKFGEYILGNTIGEGEFGKVKLGWKQEGGIQVAIKLIKKDQLGSNPSRMAKIMREVAILKQLTHPNIVRLHKMEESERHFGIILEYASGGELFDYILNHRYLKDNAARRLFAQLVSGVGYLHKKGIVHRDLKLENLLLDRNRNIIITDFGFANTFDPVEELTEEEENNLSDREFVKRMGLNQLKPSGMRKGDLMQTSCGSPCYAAPELVVSDSLYTGRKVDVWSCGVILYAMLAGYLPFDDDPANPEGDNINLLYKYIVNTPLTFPEYVTPHARDLLRRILVPNPRKRADLFEVARHSWLSEYAHVVEFITSSTTTPGEIQNTTVPAEDETPMVARSASVREAHKKNTVGPSIGGLTSKQGTVDPDTEAANHARQQRDNKRRTVQVEYVAPNTQTQRGEPATTHGSSKTRARSGSQGPVEVQSSSANEKPLPRDPPVTRESYGAAPISSRRPPSAHLNNQNLVQPSRPSREGIRAASDGQYMTSAGASGRPTTGGSTGSKGYGTGRATIQQPAGRAAYPEPSASEDQGSDYGRPSVNTPSKLSRVSGYTGEADSTDSRGHRRSNTIGDIGNKIFGRSGSVFGGRSNRKSQISSGEKSKKYPPVSMTQPISDDAPVRPSMDSKRSRRSFSLGLGKKRSGSMNGSQTSLDRQANKRFSLLPSSFSLKAIGLGKEYDQEPRDSQRSLPMQEPPQVDDTGRYVEQPRAPEAADIDGMYAQLQGSQQSQYRDPNQSQRHNRSTSNPYQSKRQSGIPAHMQQGAILNSASDSSIENAQRPTNQSGYLEEQQGRENKRASSRGTRGLLQKNKRFVDAYDKDEYSRHGSHDHAGSSGAARRVMDFFRRRGKDRGGDDR